MNDDYLWDKTGDDPEIKRLEQTLGVFRAEPGRAPIPALKLENVSKDHFSLSRWLKFAVAAPAAAAVIIAAVWMWPGNEKELSAAVPTGIGEVDRTDPAPQQMLPAGPAAISPASETGPAPARRTRKIMETRASRTRLTAVKTRSTRTELTAEEKYAYDRLMLALSISSSKLRIVRDAIERGDTDEDQAGSDKR